jgi:DNA-binding FadR family transcriptional regulator
MEAGASDAEKFSFHDYEFHRSLSETTHNPLLALLLDTVHGMMAEVRSIIISQKDLFERVMPTHRRILATVAASDPKGAREAMREHLRIALEIQTELINAQKRASG